jgi:hypothetical protein
MAWKVCGDTDLPLAGRDQDWDGDIAAASIFHKAGWETDQADYVLARRGFFACDDEAPQNKTAYKLPFAAVIEGRLKAVPRGIFSVAQVLEGARGGVDLPDHVKVAIRRKVTQYYHAMGEEPPWSTKQPQERTREKTS